MTLKTGSKQHVVDDTLHTVNGADNPLRARSRRYAQDVMLLPFIYKVHECDLNSVRHSI